MSAVWLCLETVDPPMWGLRVGNVWHKVEFVMIKTHMTTRTFDRQPRGVLTCQGVVTFHDRGTMAVIHPMPPKPIVNRILHRALQSFEREASRYIAAHLRKTFKPRAKA